MDVMESVNELISFNKKIVIDAVTQDKVSTEDIKEARKHAKIISDAGLYNFPEEASTENFLNSVKDFLNSFQDIKH